MLRLGVLVSGGGTNLQAIMDAIDKGCINAKIETVVSNRPDAYALERAGNKGIEAVCIRKKDFEDKAEYEKSMIQHFKTRNIDLILMAGFMVILSSEFVNAFENKIMNVHPALIPSFCGEGYYGLKVHEEALKKGVKITGATVHFVSPITDGGPIILQKAVEVKEGDTPETLQRRVMEEAEWVIYPEAIRLYADNKLIVENDIVRRLD